ncbi:hypothetical protein N7461_009219 [Penicillium sp. DV-2018c]|nr:hypothetical protein N7461_009219 [Penicillium sp. DV-2018c]
MASSVVRLSPAAPVQEPIAFEGKYKQAANSIIGELLSRSKPSYTHTELAEFGVSVQSFDPEDPNFTDSEACLFLPLTQRELEEFKDTFDDDPQDPSHPEHYHLWDRAQQIITLLELFESYYMKKMDGDTVSIAEASYWDIIKDEDSFCDTPPDMMLGITLGHSTPKSLPHQKTTRPHIKLVTLTSAKAKESELLHGEIGSIANAIQCRVHQPEFRNASIFPVLMLSFFGPRHGRILQAKLDNSGTLKVWSSPIYNFVDSDEKMKLFVRYNNCKPRDGREFEPLLVKDSPSSRVQYQAPLPERTKRILIF